MVNILSQILLGIIVSIIACYIVKFIEHDDD